MMSKRDRYKRIISLFAAILLLCFLTSIFAVAWYMRYVDVLVLPFYRRGNWVLIAIYAIITALFFKAYGGFKLGYLKKTDMLCSQLISMVCVNIITYFVISLIGRDFMDFSPILLVTAVDFIFINRMDFPYRKALLSDLSPKKTDNTLRKSSGSEAGTENEPESG